MLRGVQVPPMASPEVVQAALDVGVKLIRNQMVLFYTPAEKEEWKAQMRLHLDNLDILLAKTHGAKFVIDVHTPPAGQLFAGVAWAREALIELWIEIAHRYNNHPKIAAFGILNEPVGGDKFLALLMHRVAREIRKIDKHTPIAVTCSRSEPSSFDRIAVTPHEAPIWHEFHMYTPMSLTHEGIYDNPVGRRYPTKNTTKGSLVYFMRKVKRFQADYPGSQVYVGEFGISDFADPDSRFNYIRDLVDIFEANNWYWTYHAWREAPVWTCENNPKMFAYLKKKWSS